ncbi:MAG: hypothetical protein DSZ05_08840 [Sulfurospirillum sp.]|nr:MAG: hypothetical protein DSZ05_08840 [Sulfurospirillum sp.]
MISQNYVYIPGGFDVDGDGIDEGGFWLAKYEAKESNETVSPLNLGTIREAIRNNFLIYNPETRLFDQQLDANSTVYRSTPLFTVPELHVNRIVFNDEGNATGSYSPVEAAVAMNYSQIEDVPWRLSLPSEKQWMQVVKLVINNKANWTSGKVGEGRLYQGKRYSSTNRRYFVIENSILGNDKHVPKDYSTRVYDLSGGLAEWTKGMFAINDRFLGGNAGLIEYMALGANAPMWWMPVLEGEARPLHSIYGAGMYFDGSNTSGATDTLNLTGVTGDVDPFAVVARGGSAAIGDESLTGVSAAKLSYGPGFKDPSIGFRGASEYVE